MELRQFFIGINKERLYEMGEAKYRHDYDRLGKHLSKYDFPALIVHNKQIIFLFDGLPGDLILLKADPLFQERVCFEVGYAPGYKVKEKFEGTILDGLNYTWHGHNW